MASEQNSAELKRAVETPADKTDKPRGVRDEDALSLIEGAGAPRVSLGAPLSEVVGQLKDSEAGFVVVCGADGRASGVITEQDVLAKVFAEEVDLNAPAGESSAHATLPATATIGDVVRTMNERGARHVLLEGEGGQLAGAVGALDVITFLAESYPKETMNISPLTGMSREGDRPEDV